jgi:uncharacterized protein (DUF983 family)
MPNSSALKAAINARCPQCREGRLFKYKWWNLFKFAQMEENCSACNMRYEVEPGFFYGAMYISYAFTVGIMLVGGLIIYNLFNDPDAMGYVIPITLISLALVPANFRISRVIFIHLFSGVTYRPNK